MKRFLFAKVEKERGKNMEMALWIALIVLGFILLIKGADLLVEGASNVAKKCHIPEIIIGLTIVSIGTSLPEVFVSIKSALGGHSDMAIGNVVGSNIANLLLILGLSAIIKAVSFKRETRLIEIPICLAVSIIFMILANVGQNITRIDAGVLVALFIVFIIFNPSDKLLFVLLTFYHKITMLSIFHKEL